MEDPEGRTQHRTLSSFLSLHLPAHRSSFLSPSLISPGGLVSRRYGSEGERQESRTRQTERDGDRGRARHDKETDMKTGPTSVSMSLPSSVFALGSGLLSVHPLPSGLRPPDGTEGVTEAGMIRGAGRPKTRDCKAKGRAGSLLSTLTRLTSSSLRSEGRVNVVSETRRDRSEGKENVGPRRFPCLFAQHSPPFLCRLVRAHGVHPYHPPHGTERSGVERGGWEGKGMFTLTVTASRLLPFPSLTPSLPPLTSGRRPPARSAGDGVRSERSERRTTSPEKRGGNKSIL